MGAFKGDPWGWRTVMFQLFGFPSSGAIPLNPPPHGVVDHHHRGHLRMVLVVTRRNAASAPRRRWLQVSSARSTRGEPKARLGTVKNKERSALTIITIQPYLPSVQLYLQLPMDLQVRTGVVRHEEGLSGSVSYRTFWSGWNPHSRAEPL